MTNRNSNTRPLAGGNYVRDERGLRQVDKATAPNPGKSARQSAAKPQPAHIPHAGKPASDK